MAKHLLKFTKPGEPPQWVKHLGNVVTMTLNREEAQEFSYRDAYDHARRMTVHTIGWKYTAEPK